MKKILLILLIVLAALIGWLCVPFNILVIGVDAYANQPTEGSRSDGLIVVRVIPYLAQIKMVSIPRDTYAEIPCENYKQDKITHSHHFGGTQCTIDAVENLLDTKINYHVRFRFEDVMNITNLIDGVDVVANHTFNQDYFDQEVYHFDKGKVYNLRGRMALAYTRHRKSDTAFKRDERQRQVIQGIAKKIAAKMTKRELQSGIQTIQYQVNTLLTTNGQAPFVAMFMNIKEGMPYEKEMAMIIEEVLSQRIEGIENAVGVKITPSFPKLVYVLNESTTKGGKYYYLTELAAKCTAKRMYPDYISEKKMSEIYSGNCFSPMGCRSFLPAWKDKNGNYKFEGRLNIGVQTLNLPQIAILANKDKNLFYNILEERLKLIREMGMLRYNLLKNQPSDVSPIHWQYGGIARLGQGEKIGKLFLDGYATISVGYIGLHEAVYAMLSESITTKEGHEFALDILNFMKSRADRWKEETRLAFTLYGTPSESTAGRLCEIDAETFGDIEGVTDKGYYTNSYHVTPSEDIDAFSKLKLESQFQTISTGGCISYIEIPNMTNNVEAIETVIDFMYNNITYAEFNTKSDYCQVCGYDGEIMINDDLVWECPQCHNKDMQKMNVVRRTCGYLGENFWSKGRTKDIKDRVMHL